MSHTLSGYPERMPYGGRLNANTSYQPIPDSSPALRQQQSPPAPRSWRTFGQRQKRKAKDVAKELDHAVQQTPAYKRMKRMRQTTRAISTITSAFMFAAMTATSLIFANTLSERVDNRPIWPRQPSEWPTYLLLAGAAVSLLTAIITMLMFCCCYERASKSWKLVLALNSVEVTYWVVVAVVYRVEKRLNDLWGWSCSDVAASLQDNGASVHFDKLCTLQTVSWWVSVAETVLKVFVLAWTIVLLKKLRKETEHQKMKIIDIVGGGISDGINNFLI
ncbi:uncharacterized protein HMPREF1541_09411 [Cyphellophora europaea CBS 101466]|uniref:MARVEL domain-containing protein n=1 Tax=Cyphellophora europaea (strain CBS 101466) TaxID=1220924 RepID=W2SCC7_CYPE1|nr:uncharacterized protein HMPREF1541_09411 [Cyphellophora europaea CBS 101466]ETN45579.1 hypothetical protein HMPREF1541_09411 [Cyphellophora europaea CBS 101466]